MTAIIAASIGIIIVAAIVRLIVRSIRTDAQIVSTPSPVRQMIDEIKSIYIDRHEHRPATDADFTDRDVAWYESTTQQLIALGFQSLGDRVNQTVEQASGLVVVTRRFISADQTTMTGIYHFVRPNKNTGAIVSLRVCDFESELSDGSFVTTNNTAGANLASLPGQILGTKHPIETTAAELARLHEAEKTQLLQDKPNAHFVKIQNLEEYDASQQRQLAIKAAFRQGIGYVDPAEIRRIADQKWPNDPDRAANVVDKFDSACKQVD
jgi:hypothetical protein